MAQPPKIVIPGLNRGAGVPPGYVLGRLPGTGHGPAQLLNLNALRKVGLATASGATQSTSQAISTAQSLTTSLSTAVSSSISSVTSVNVGQSTSLSQISSSLSGAISSTTSLSTAVSTVISGSVSTLNSRIDSLSAAGGGGATTFLALTDTPATYVGQAAKVVRVNAGETALEFAAGSVDPGQSTSLSQISASLSSEISSRTSGDTSLSTVISGSISTVNSSITSLSTAVSTVISSSISTVTSSVTSLSTALGTITFGVEIDGGGSVISTGLAAFSKKIVPAHTITKVTAMATDTTGPATACSITVDVWNDTFANYPPTSADKISASAPVTLAGAASSEDSTLTGWDVTTPANSVYAFDVKTVTAALKVLIQIEATI